MSKQEIIRRIASQYGLHVKNDDLKRIARDQYQVTLSSQSIWNTLGNRAKRLGNGTAMQLDEAKKFLRMTGKDYDVAVRVLRIASTNP